jgi:tRNA threonylcarbamoyl adenosine modification protein YeaZ
MVLVRILAIDTSTPCGSVAVVRDGTVVGVTSTWTDEAYSSRMFRHLEWLLRELGATLEDIDLFAIITGPGSFTGLRVGLAAVKGWAEVYSKPIIGVNALEAIAAQSRSTDSVLVPVLDARRGEVYFGHYRRHAGNGPTNLVRAGETLVMSPQKFFADVHQSLGDQTFTIVTSTPQVFVNEIGQQNDADHGGRRLTIESVSGVLAPVAGEIAWRRIQAGGTATSDSLTLDANYVRRTDAEVKWKGN